jgi:hypothetical protein
MAKGSNFQGGNFIGQPVLGQILKLLDKRLVQSIADERGSDRYTKKLTTHSHLCVLLFGVISHCVSLREIEYRLQSEGCKAAHLGMGFKLSRSTLADANRRRSEKVFGGIYQAFYRQYSVFLSDSRKYEAPAAKVFAIDSTTITLFSEILRGTCKPNDRLGRRKGGIKVHTVMNVEEGVPCLLRFSKAAKADVKYMHLVRQLPKGSVAAMDRAFSDHREYEKLSRMGIWYVTRLKDIIKYETVEVMHDSPSGLGVQRDEIVTLSLAGSRKRHKARRIVYIGKVMDGGRETLKTFVYLTNNLEMEAETVAQIYRSRWQIELLFKKIKQNFPLKYFYGDSKNAVKTQIWAVMIACLLLTVVHRKVCVNGRGWAFSNMLSIIRGLIMSYIDIYAFLEKNGQKPRPKKAANMQQAPPEMNLFCVAMLNDFEKGARMFACAKKTHG